MHHADAIGDRECLLLIVRHQNGGRATCLQDLTDFVTQALSQLDVETGKRFIHQQQRRSGRECTGQRYALLLAAGKLVRVMSCPWCEAHQIEHFLNASGTLGGTGGSQPECDVALHREMRKQCVVLEHEADVAALRWSCEVRTGHHEPVDLYRARRDRQEPGDGT